MSQVDIPVTGSQHVFERVLEVLSALPVALIVIVTFIDVFARYVFSSPLKGSMEIVEYAMALVIFMAIPIVTHKRAHVSVSLVDAWFKGNAQRVRMVICDGLSMVALWLLAWRLWVQAFDDLETGNQTEVLALPHAPLDFALAALAAIAALTALALMWHSAKGEGASS